MKKKFVKTQRFYIVWLNATWISREKFPFVFRHIKVTKKDQKENQMHFKLPIILRLKVVSRIHGA